MGESNYKGSLGQDCKEPLDFGIKSEETKESFLGCFVSECYSPTHFSDY